jgi:HEPN domain-containing protein
MAVASDDFRVAQVLESAPTVQPRHACFYAQQCAEKAIKAILGFAQLDVPRTHDLEVLRSLLPDGWTVKAHGPDLTELSKWAVGARYPDLYHATPEDARAAVTTAAKVLELVRVDLQRSGVDFIEESAGQP